MVNSDSLSPVISRLSRQCTCSGNVILFQLCVEKIHATRIQERPLMQNIKGRRFIVYACVLCKIYQVPAETFYHMTYSTNHFVRTV